MNAAGRIYDDIMIFEQLLSRPIIFIYRKYDKNPIKYNKKVKK